jgi:hypothetical protein
VSGLQDVQGLHDAAAVSARVAAAPGVRDDFLEAQVVVALVEDGPIVTDSGRRKLSQIMAGDH